MDANFYNNFVLAQGIPRSVLNNDCFFTEPLEFNEEPDVQGISHSVLKNDCFFTKPLELNEELDVAQVQGIPDYYLTAEPELSELDVPQEDNNSSDNNQNQDYSHNNEGSHNSILQGTIYCMYIFSQLIHQKIFGNVTFLPALWTLSQH